MTEERRSEIYNAQRGTNWTPMQITRYRKKLNANTRRAILCGESDLPLNPKNVKYGLTNWDLANT